MDKKTQPIYELTLADGKTAMRTLARPTPAAQKALLTALGYESFTALMRREGENVQELMFLQMDIQLDAEKMRAVAEIVFAEGLGDLDVTQIDGRDLDRAFADFFEQRGKSLFARIFSSGTPGFGASRNGTASPEAPGSSTIQ